MGVQPGSIRRRVSDLVRPSRLVVGSVLIAALALVALPGLAGSRVPSPLEPIPASAFQPLSVSADSARSTVQIDPLDAAYDSAGAITADASFIEPGAAPQTGPTARATLNQPESGAASVRKPPRYELTGTATFYDNGTTAMRLPRGTVVIICGDGGCVERVVNDYGPIKKSRIVDLYRAGLLRRLRLPMVVGHVHGDRLGLLTSPDPARYPCRRPFDHGPVRPQGRPSEAGKER